MITVGEIYDLINEIAPFSIQESYDNSGLLVGSREFVVKKVLIALDITIDVAKEAVENNVDLIITHHPVIFRAIKNIDLTSVVGVLALNRISVISAHTNFDSADNGLNKILCDKLGFISDKSIFRNDGANIGNICTLDKSCTANQLAKHIKKSLNSGVLRYNDLNKDIKTVAVCCGSGGSFLNDVIAANADAFITGDVKHDVFIDAYNAGLCVIDAGHFDTENIFCQYMKDFLSVEFNEVDFEIAKSNRNILSYEF